MNQVDEGGERFQVDLTNCDREPIHIPSSIQTFGLLLAFDPEKLEITQISGNSGEYFGLQPEELLGKSLSEVFDSEQSAQIWHSLKDDSIEENPVQVFSGALSTGQNVNAVIHSFDGVTLLELERFEKEHQTAVDYPDLIKRVLVRLEQSPNLVSFCRRLAEEYRSISGFDRVMVYRFLPDSTGEVIGESVGEGLEPFLGLRYPASDIPQQARRLFVLNPTRLIADPRYKPIPVIPSLNPTTGRPLDMSFAALRGVSPIHCEYLQNMGVGASMSQAIVVDGKLWGLISSHSIEPRVASFATRSATEFLAKSAALLIYGIIRKEESDYEVAAAISYEKITKALAGTTSISDTLRSLQIGLEDYVDAQGCAVLIENELLTLGECPEKRQIAELSEWLSYEPHGDLFCTQSITQWEDAPELDGWVAGVLALRLTRDPKTMILWFRREIAQTVNWAGNPSKPTEETEKGQRINPRKSFELWQETVKRRSKNWTTSEVEAARRLRVSLVEALLRRAEETARKNVKLERSNNELDSFTYIASHDLKEPLRGISNYATFLWEDYGQLLDEPGKERLLTLVRLANRMEALTDSLLHYSRLDRQELEVEEMPFRSVVEIALENTRSRLEELKVDVRIMGDLPTICCDPIQLSEVLQNLVSNAAKYNTNEQKWIEVGARPYVVEETSNLYEFAFYVRDNGIGISEKHFESIFRIFKRLHGRNDYGGGSGAGLTIARKIVERHGGRLWVESNLHQGSTFLFTLERC